MGILLVIVGHTYLLPQPLFDVIYAFHMPAFMILSGWLWGAVSSKRVRNVASFAEKRVRRLLVPAWAWGLICAIGFVALSVFDKDQVSLADIALRALGTATGYPQIDFNFYTSPQWFLFALFVIEVAAAVVVRWISAAYDWAVLLGVGVVGLVVSNWIPWIPFDLNIAFSAMFFFAIGITIGRGVWRSVAQSVSRPVTATVTAAGALVVTIAIALMVPAGLVMARNLYGVAPWEILLNVIAALTGSYALWTLARFTPSRFLAWLGARTIPILSSNYIVDRIVAHFVHFWPLVLLLDVLILVALVWALEFVPPLANILNGRPIGSRVGRRRERQLPISDSAR